MSAQRTLVSAGELLKISADGKRCELIKGELVEMAPAGGLHGRIANKVAFALTSYVEAAELGTVFAAETGFIIERDPDTVRAPDAAFVSKERLPPGQPQAGFLELAPDLAVEVISPSDSASYVQAKVEQWLAAGTRLLWVIYPDSRSVTVYHSTGDSKVLSTDDTLDGAPVF